MKRPGAHIAAAGACLLFIGLTVPAATRAQATAHQDMAMKEAKPGLLAQAKIKPDSARAVALARVPNSTVHMQEIERARGRLVYSFDLAQPNKAGYQEVLVDARSGKVVSVKHESVRKERAEQRTAAMRHKGTVKKP